MPSCAFLTMADLAGYVADDELVAAPLEASGWSTEWRSWRDPADWGRFDVVVVRTTWDYHLHLDEFLGVVDDIEASGARLENPAEVIRWNVRKTYLRTLGDRGVPVIPTVWGDRLGREELSRIRDELASDRLVCKPTVGASAWNTFQIGPSTQESELREAGRRLGDGGFLAQPFVPGFVEEGEHSVILFLGEVSHTILKTPRAGDFRAQEEHGAVVRRIHDRAVEGWARDVLEASGMDTLYARVDGVRGPGGDLLLSELELVEPSLYLRMDPQAPERFARAIRERSGERRRAVGGAGS